MSSPANLQLPIATGTPTQPASSASSTTGNTQTSGLTGGMAGVLGAESQMSQLDNAIQGSISQIMQLVAQALSNLQSGLTAPPQMTPPTQPPNPGNPGNGNSGPYTVPLNDRQGNQHGSVTVTPQSDGSQQAVGVYNTPAGPINFTVNIPAGSPLPNIDFEPGQDVGNGRVNFPGGYADVQYDANGWTASGQFAKAGANPMTFQMTGPRGWLVSLT